MRNDQFKYLRFGITYLQIKYLSNSNASLVKKSNDPAWGLVLVEQKQRHRYLIIPDGPTVTLHNHFSETSE